MMNARRGFDPDDIRIFSKEGILKMQKASRDIRYLINHGYDLKSAVTFTGNHYLLSQRQRTALMRSVCTKRQLEERRQKGIRMTDLENHEVWIDGFNQIITLEVLCLHFILLDCMDGAIRDLASLRGSYHLIPETDQAIRMMFDVLERAGVSEVHVLLDEPVSNSGRLKTRIAEINEESNAMKTDIEIVRNPDEILYEKAYVITSDSIILDHCKSWFNLSRICVQDHHGSLISVWRE